MYSYSDKTYCVSPNCKNKCGVQLNSEVKRKAAEWWISITQGKASITPPIETREFCDEWGEVKNEP